MKKTCHSLNEVLKLVEIRKPKIVGIDGIDGGGKSTLARNIASKFSYSHIELDKYLKTKGGQIF